MPRPAKGKRGKGAGAVGGHDAADLLERLNSSGLGEKEVLAIVGANKVPCEHLRSPCVRNRKENVACFCQLVPAETSYRKKGLWQKEQTYLGTLGSDPKERQREDAATPAGLRNLGNTCYANAALQCLFSIPSLRTGIYIAEPAVAGHDILRQLQGLFLQMQFGPQRSVDTEALAKTLGLNHAVQQDGQEFLKLLLTRVEQLMSKSSDGAARRLVPQLFRGGLSYVTTCQRCGRDSSSSHEVQDFYDLMPQVRGFGSLTTSLASFLHAESLSGDNRYLCDFCGTKVDALRRVRLRALPPYLCLALQRFYFDPRTFDKAKALDKFAFPLTLDFSQVLAEAAAAEQAAAGAAAAAVAASTADAAGAASDAVPNADAAAPKAADAAAAAAAAVSLETPSYPVEGSPLYELVGILIHKGSQAHSGHYVAHIKDQASGQWWRFDDEVAACIGPDPAAAFQSDHGAVGAAAAAAAAAGGTAADGSTKGAGASRKRTATHDDVDYEEEAAAAGEEPGRGGGGEEEEEDDEEDGGAGGKRSGRGGRGGKKRARAGSRAGRGGSSGGGRGGKKGTAAAAAGVSAESGAGKSRGRGGQGRRGGRRGRTSGAVDMDGDASDADGELRAALAASMALQQEDEGLRFAMEASMADAAGLGVGGVGGGDTGAAAGEAGGAHAGDAEEAALVQMALEESEREAEMAAVLAGAGGAGRGGGGGGGAAGGGGGGGDAAELGEDGAGQQGDARSPMESDAEAVAAAMAASLADAAAPTPPRLTPPPSLMSAPPLRPSHLRPLALKSDEAGDDLKGSVHNSPKSGPAAAAAIKGETIGKAGGVGGSGSLVSANAYMLVYRAVGLQEPPPARTVEELPAALQAAVAEVAAAYADECDVYQRQRDALKTQVEERRRSVRELLSCISPRLPLQTSSQQPLQQQQPEVIGDDEDSADASAPQEQQQQQPGTAGYWVSMPWLEQWANDEGAPPPIDNGPITCAIHSRAGARGGAAAGAAGGAGDSQSQGGGGGAGTGSCLDPAKVAAAKLVSAEAWERLHAAHGGGPVLAAGDVCRQCLEGSASQALLGNQAEEVRRRVAALLEAGPAAGAEAEWEEAEVEEAMDAEEDASPRSFWVSRLWLQGWSKRQGASVKAEKSPTADLACPHGELQPARAAKRVAVPADIWRFLRDLWRRQRLAEAQDAAAGKPAPVGRGRGHKASSADAGGVNGSAGAGVGAGAGSPSPPAVDCMDLTGDDAPGLAASGKAGKRETVEIDQDDRVIGDDDDDDEDDMQMIDAPSAQAGGAPAGAAPEAAGAGGLREDEDGSANRRSREASAVPPSREGTADVEAPVPPSELGAAADAAAGKPAATAAAAAAPARIPTAAELEAMCPELPVGRVFECELCREAAGQAASAHADSRRQLDMERNALSGLKMEAWPQLTPGCQYYMVPTSWVREWQQYVRVLPKGTPAAPRPSSLSAAMLRVLCPCHPDEPRLGVPPPRLTVSKRSRLSQLDLEQDPMRLITQEDWDHLRHVYLRDLNNASSAAAADAYAVAGTSTGTVGGRDVGGGKRRAFQRASAAIANGAHGAEDGDAGAGYAVGSNGNGRALLQEDGAADVVVKDGADGSSGAAANAAQLAAVAHGFTADVAQLVEEQQDTGAAATVSASAATGRIGGGSSRRRGDGGEAAGAVRAPDVLVWPPVCWAALAEQGRAAREAALVYSEAEVMVELVAAEDLEGAFKDSGVGLERRSRRTRKGRTSITVSNTTTLEQLKLQIFESLSIHPKNQTLYVRGDDGSPRQLQGDELSLAQHEVLPGAELRLVRLRLVDDDDDVAGLFGEGRAKRRQVEEGFKNTALHGDLPLQQQEAAAGAEQGADQGSSGAAGVQEAVEDDSHVV